MTLLIYENNISHLVNHTVVQELNLRLGQKINSLIEENNEFLFRIFWFIQILNLSEYMKSETISLIIELLTKLNYLVIPPRLSISTN